MSDYDYCNVCNLVHRTPMCDGKDDSMYTKTIQSEVFDKNKFPVGKDISYRKYNDDGYYKDIDARIESVTDNTIEVKYYEDDWTNRDKLSIDDIVNRKISINWIEN